MKVLVATKEGQGKRANDFSWTTEGELVGFSMECDGEKIDGRCGCRRSFAGLDSHKATTTAKVVELDMTPEDVVVKVRESLESAGWIKPGDPKGIKWAEQDAAELVSIAEHFPVGMVLEKRGDNIQERVVA